MRIGMFVLLYFKGPVLFFQFNADVYIDVGIMRVVFVIFYKSSTEFVYTLYKLSFFVDQDENAQFIFFTDFKVIRAKSRSCMNDSASIFCCDEISTYDTERICPGRDVSDLLQAPGYTWNQLFIATVFKPGSGKRKKISPRKYFRSGLITFEIGIFIFRFKIFSDQGFCQNHINGKMGIWVKGLNKCIFDLRTYRQ